MASTVRTRFAPSPTGYLHIGGARTALFSWAYARRHGGTFILRIEDTDVARSTPEAVQAILDGMSWLDLNWDEGPFYQMQRMDRYKEVIQQMLAAGTAYPCYMPPEELDALREAQRARGEKPRYDGRWRPEPGKVLNASYRLNRETSSPVNQVDVSGQWPISGRWHAVGRLNYSFKDDGTVLSTGGQSGRIIESIAGLEYNGGCWIVRGVVRRRALTSEDASTAFYVQLELSGLGRIGSNPLSLLKRSIQGYSLISNQDDGAGFDD